MANGRSHPRGLTLLELVVSLAITSILMAMTVNVIGGFDRDQLARRQVTDVQGRARLALRVLERELREAALTAATGVVWTDRAGAATPRPAVQIFEDVPGGAALVPDVKPGTDALLVVEASGTARTATVGETTTSVGSVNVTSVDGFSVGDTVLLSEYADASWGVVTAVQPSNDPTVPPTVALASPVNVLPGTFIKRLGAGASVRTARARLYYVTQNDELVQLTLRVPRAPTAAADVVDRSILAAGVENMQADCQLDTGTGGLGPCQAPLDPADPLAVESATMFGAFTPGTGPRLTAAVAGTVGSVTILRTVSVALLVRSVRPVNTGQGDEKTALFNEPLLPVGGSPDAAPYVRRVYTLTAGVRNTSLGVL